MEPHWLVRPRTIRLLWIAFAVVLAATVAVEFLVAKPAHGGVGDTFAFGAWFGFLACAALILVAKGIGVFLKRPDDYYGPGDD